MLVRLTPEEISFMLKLLHDKSHSYYATTRDRQMILALLEKFKQGENK